MSNIKQLGDRRYVKKHAADRRNQHTRFGRRSTGAAIWRSLRLSVVNGKRIVSSRRNRLSHKRAVEGSVLRSDNIMLVWPQAPLYGQRMGRLSDEARNADALAI